MLRYFSFFQGDFIMAEVIPFQGVLYNPDRVDPSLTTAPPYDVVTPAFKDSLYQQSPFNIIRIDFGKDDDDDNENENRYTRASRFLSHWLSEGIFLQDKKTSFYCYEVRYRVEGQDRKMLGFLGAVKIEELGKGKVHPHEMTYSKPKSDRLNILRYCNANTSPIFSIYSSKEKVATSIIGKTTQQAPFIEASDEDGFLHRLWKIDDPDRIEKIRVEMADKDVFIADGHHRYETAQTFKKEMEEKGLSTTGDEPFNYTLMFLSNMEDEGLTLLPTHRIVEIDSDIRIREVLSAHFHIKKISSKNDTDEQSRQRMLTHMKQHIHSFGMFRTNTGNYYTLTYNGKDMDVDLPDCLKNLDVTVLHRFIFEKLLNIHHYEYEMSPELAVKKAQEGSFEAVFFLNATGIQDVKEAALAGHRMPPKSTYFYPKLLTGMVLYRF
jgi:uncharacterized protein (DUF1015 family)